MTDRSSKASLFRAIQDHISKALELCDGIGKFSVDIWTRSDLHASDGGGGETRVLKDGAVFEKAGVNFSQVHGVLSAEFCERLIQVREETPFFATGVSLVIHPHSPLIPTTHANWRYLEVGDYSWFGGGSDLTPYYLFDEDAKHFHSVLKEVCDRHDPMFYPKFKKWCDQYFYLPHRNECRGVGGIFFDYLGREKDYDLLKLESFVSDLGFAFTDQYLPIVERRKKTHYSETEREFQLLRRGRYVEFNLLYDRGTQFGLQTNGRVESILMSLPPLVRWEYDFKVVPGSREEALLSTVSNPREWV